MEDGPLPSKPLILFAEDDDDFFVITRYALEKAGFAGGLELVHNMGELIEYLRDGGTPDLIILDLKTAPEDWREALKEVKKDKRSGGVPVVVLTASSEPEDVDLCEVFPKCSHVLKPTTFHDWKICMEDVMRLHLSEPGEVRGGGCHHEH